MLLKAYAPQLAAFSHQYSDDRLVLKHRKPKRALCSSGSISIGKARDDKSSTQLRLKALFAS